MRTLSYEQTCSLRQTFLRNSLFLLVIAMFDSSNQKPVGTLSAYRLLIWGDGGSFVICPWSSVIGPWFDVLGRWGDWRMGALLGSPEVLIAV
jgi:hypothetical protein